MFSRPFADFDPGESELRAGASVRKFIVERVRAAIEPTCCTATPRISHTSLSRPSRGPAAADRDSRLGSSRASIDRRWRLAIDAMLAGFGA
jgi:hypothetical protein